MEAEQGRSSEFFIIGRAQSVVGVPFHTLECSPRSTPLAHFSRLAYAVWELSPVNALTCSYFVYIIPAVHLVAEQCPPASARGCRSARTWQPPRHRAFLCDSRSESLLATSHRFGKPRRLVTLAEEVAIVPGDAARFALRRANYASSTRHLSTLHHLQDAQIVARHDERCESERSNGGGARTCH